MLSGRYTPPSPDDSLLSNQDYTEPLISPVSAASTSASTPPTPLQPSHPPSPSSIAPYESLDFETLINSFTKSISSQTTVIPENPSPNRRRTLIGYTGRTFVRWLLTIVTGLLTGSTAIAIVWNIGEGGGKL